MKTAIARDLVLIGISKPEAEKAVSSIPEDATDYKASFAAAIKAVGKNRLNKNDDAEGSKPKDASLKVNQTSIKVVALPNPDVLKKVGESNKSNEKLGEGLTKLGEEIGGLGEKMSGLGEAIKESLGVRTGKALRAAPGFETKDDRIAKRKASLDDFFTLRGFLNKTGIVAKGSGGRIDRALAKKEMRDEFISDQIAMGARDTKGMRGKSKAEQREVLAKRFEVLNTEGQKLEKLTTKKDMLLKKGYSDEQIAKTGLDKKIEAIVSVMEKADPLRIGAQKRETPEQTEKQPKPLTVPEKEPKVPRTKDSASSIELLNDQNALILEQTGLLKAIESNTAKVLRSDSDEPEQLKQYESGDSDGGLFGLRGIAQVFKGLAPILTGILGFLTSPVFLGLAASIALVAGGAWLGKKLLEALPKPVHDKEQGAADLKEGKSSFDAQQSKVEKIKAYEAQGMSQGEAMQRVAQETAPGVVAVSKPKANPIVNKPRMGDVLTTKSAENEAAKIASTNQSTANATIVSAPSTNIQNTTVQGKRPERNQDRSSNRLLASVY